MNFSNDFKKATMNLLFDSRQRTLQGMGRTVYILYLWLKLFKKVYFWTENTKGWETSRNTQLCTYISRSNISMHDEHKYVCSFYNSRKLFTTYELFNISTIICTLQGSLKLQIQSWNRDFYAAGYFIVMERSDRGKGPKAPEYLELGHCK